MSYWIVCRNSKSACDTIVIGGGADGRLCYTFRNSRDALRFADQHSAEAFVRVCDFHESRELPCYGEMQLGFHILEVQRDG